jgi:hypothetical protein
MEPQRARTGNNHEGNGHEPREDSRTSRRAEGSPAEGKSQRQANDLDGSQDEYSFRAVSDITSPSSVTCG